MGSKFVLCPSEAASSAVKGGKGPRFKAVTLLLMSDMLMELVEGRARVRCHVLAASDLVPTGIAELLSFGSCAWEMGVLGMHNWKNHLILSGAFIGIDDILAALLYTCNFFSIMT